MIKIKTGVTAAMASVGVFIFTTLVSLADSVGSPQQAVTLTDPLGGNESFTTVATNVTQFLFTDVAIPLVVIMVLVGAFQIMTSGGDPEKFSKGRKTITYAAVGFVAAAIALGAADLIQSFLAQK